MVCVGRGEELEALVLVGGGAGAFPFDMGGVAVWLTSVVESLDFPRSGLALDKGESIGSGVPALLESFWIVDVTVVSACLRRSSTWAVSSSGFDLLELLSELGSEFVPLVGVSLKCTVLLLWYCHWWTGVQTTSLLLNLAFPVYRSKLVTWWKYGIKLVRVSSGISLFELKSVQVLLGGMFHTQLLCSQAKMTLSPWS